MSNILDLSVIQPEPLIIKIPNGDIFTIPGSISLSIVLHFENQYKKLAEKKDNREEYMFMKSAIIDILKLDKENAKKVTDKYITDNNIDSMNYMTAIFDAFINHVTKLRSDENLDSPQN